MAYPLWTFGVALGMGLAMLIYQHYGQHRRRQEESSFNYVQRRSNNVSHHDRWQSQEPSTSEGSGMRHRGEKKNGNKKHETAEKSIVVVEKVKSCGICTKPLRSNLRRLDCGHEYHAACAIEWRRKNYVCPVCGVQFF